MRIATRFTPAVERLLEDALTLARRRKHPAVMPVHFLAALAAGDLWRQTLAPVARPELARLVERRLAEVPEIGGYRDGASAIPITPEARALVSPRWALLPQTIDLRWVVARLAERPEVATLFAEATLDLGEVDVEVDLARARAASRKHVAVRLEHVLRELTERAWLDVALRSLGSSSASLASVLDARIATFVARRTGDPHIADALLRAVLHTKLIAAPRARRAPTSDQFLAVALEDIDVRTLLQQSSIPVAELWSLLVDGRLRNAVPVGV